MRVWRHSLSVIDGYDVPPSRESGWAYHYRTVSSMHLELDSNDGIADLCYVANVAERRPEYMPSCGQRLTL